MSASGTRTEEAAIQTIILSDALTRFECEAKYGTVDTGHYRCRYVTWGSGPPLILIHGLGDDPISFVMPMASLCKNFQCIAYHQPNGRGDRAKLSGYRHEDLMDDLFVLMDHLQLREAALFGSSFGSTIALRAMHSRPERISRGIVQGGFASRPLRSKEWWLAWAARFWPGSMRLLPFHRSAMLKVHRTAFTQCDPEVWRFFLKQSGKPAIRSVAHWALMLHETDIRELLPSIRQPVLLICGDNDPLVPRSCQDYLFNHLPNAMMFEIPGCGHFPMFSHCEATVYAIRQFLGAQFTVCTSPCKVNGQL